MADGCYAYLVDHNIFLRQKMPLIYLLIAIFTWGPYTCLSQQEENLWPLPQSVNTSQNTLQFIPKEFDFIVSGNSCDILEVAFLRWWHRTFPPNGKHCCDDDDGASKHATAEQSVLDKLKVKVLTPCEGIYPSLESDESYGLEITSASSTLTANTVWGILHGLETFSQLIYRNQKKMYVVNETSIADFPRFKHRGLLLDTSRHFLSKEIILHNLDAMAQNKFNVFHWHIVDDSSFPYQSYSFPNLTEKGAFHPITHVYTQQDIKEIIEAARLLGIRVIPEFDSPGHTKSWGAAYRELLTTCYDTYGYFPNGRYGPVNPVAEYTYTFMQTLFGEISKVFPDHYIHVGGDEVNFDCWKSNPKILQFMSKNRFNKDFTKLEEYYIRRIIDIIKDLGKNYIVWQEVFDNDNQVPKDTIIQIWKEDHEYELAQVTSKGFKALLSSCWYLNYISYGSDWHKYYTCDPQDFRGSPRQKELVIGGEACMWGEYVDSTNLMARLWPRASVVAERLWSSKDVHDYSAANRRLMNHRCRMVRRGIPAQPISGPGFCSIEWDPGNNDNIDLSSGNHLASEKIMILLYFVIFMLNI